MIKPFRAFSYWLSFPHICSSHPCRIGNAADYQWSIGIMGLSPLRGSLRAAPSKKRRKYHYTRHLHRRKQPHHTAVIALRRSLTPLREVLASEAVLLRRSGKIRSTELFTFQGAVKKFKNPLHFTTDKKSQNGGCDQKLFLIFLQTAFFVSNTLLWLHPFSLANFLTLMPPRITSSKTSL